MMGKYLSLANEYAQKFKPVIEEKGGIKLDNIVVKSMRTLPKYKDESHLDNLRTLMFVIPHFDHRGAIYMNEDKYKKKENASEEIPITVNHELTHIGHDKVFKEGLKNVRPSPLKIWLCKRYYKSKSFKEGFAEYMALDYLIDIYDSQAFQEAVKKRSRISVYRNDFSDDYIPYERGYKFFRKVLSVIGKDKVFEVARSPPISEIEMRIPLLYLLRKYPAKGIKNIPKSLSNGIRSKIFKRIHGYAPLYF